MKRVLLLNGQRANVVQDACQEDVFVGNLESSE